MIKFQRFNDFIQESIDVSLDEMSDINIDTVIFEALAKCPFLTNEERLYSEIILETNQCSNFFNNSLNEESIADKIKTKTQAALAVVKDKGKKYLSDAQETILKFGGNVKKLIGLILKSIQDFLKKSWQWINTQVEKGYAGSIDKIIEAAKGKFEGKSDVAKKEVQNLAAMATGSLKWCVGGGATKEIAGGLNKASSIDEQYLEIVEKSYAVAIAELITEDEEFVDYLRGDSIDIVAEGGGGIKIPFLSTLAHKVAEFEPFKSLHKVEHLAGDIANKG